MAGDAARRSHWVTLWLVVTALVAAVAVWWHRMYWRHGESGRPDDDPLGLAGYLHRTGRFARDTLLGSLFHWGKISMREITPEHSLHITLSGNRLSAHIDRWSPLADEHHRAGGLGESTDPLSAFPGWVARYSVTRAVVHSCAHVLDAGVRLLSGQPGAHRLELECEVVQDDGAGGEAAAAPADRIGAQPRCVPFSMIDEAVQILDAEAAPWSIQFELRVAGRLDEERLGTAVRTGLLRHPLAHARRVPARASERGHEWELAPDLDIDPLRVVDCPDDGALDAARSELYTLQVPLAESPPLRIRLARHPAGDLLLLNVNHVAMDGFGVLRVLRSIARAYRGAPDPVPQVDLRATRDLPALFGAEDAEARRARYAVLLDKVGDLLGPPARLAADGGRPAPGYGFHHRRLTEGETRTVLGGMPEGSTVNDLLLGALHLAVVRWNADHGVASRRIGVLVPVNLWPGRPDGVVGNYSLPVRVTTTARSRSSRAALLESITAQTREMKEHGTGAALIEVLGGAASLPIWAKRALPALLWLTGNRLVDTAQLSNLGHVDDLPWFGEDAGETTELWFSPPARMPLGLSIGAVTAAERLHVAFRYRHPLFDAEAAGRFADLYVRSLEVIAG